MCNKRLLNISNYLLVFKQQVNKHNKSFMYLTMYLTNATIHDYRDTCIYGVAEERRNGGMMGNGPADRHWCVLADITIFI